MDADKVRIYEDAQETFLGYPCNTAYDYSALYESLRFRFNNIGDPSVPSLYKIHTKDEERKVLDFFAGLWGFDRDDVWGYITHSGTEGNMQGLFLAREVFPEGVLYCSADSHYSIHKIARILKLPVRTVRSLSNGEMDYEAFAEALDTERPAIVCANLGTTMKGGIDDVERIHAVLTDKGMDDKYYLHADGALMGFVLPFMETDVSFKRHVHSISISGHKFLGVPFPCGVFVMEKHFLDRLNNEVEYIGSIDNTISGSRNGHAALFLNHVISRKGYEGFKKDVDACVANAEYLVGAMKRWNAWRNEHSITVIFDRAPEEICRKWQLASQQDVSHVVVMPHCDRPKLDAFVKDLTGA